MKPFLRVHFGDEDFIDCEVEGEGTLDAALSAYIDSGGTRDRLILLERDCGGGITIRASRVQCWHMITEESMRTAIDRAKELDDVIKAREAEIGVFE